MTYVPHFKCEASIRAPPERHPNRVKKQLSSCDSGDVVHEERA